MSSSPLQRGIDVFKHSMWSCRRPCSLWSHAIQRQLAYKPLQRTPCSSTSLSVDSSYSSIPDNELAEVGASRATSVPVDAQHSQYLTPSHASSTQHTKQSRLHTSSRAAVRQAFVLLVMGAGSLPLLAIWQAADTAVTGLVATSQCLNQCMAVPSMKPTAPPSPLVWTLMVCAVAVMAVLPIVTQVIPLVWQVCCSCCATVWNAVSSNIAAACSSADGCSVFDFGAAGSHSTVVAAGVTSSSMAVQICLLYTATWVMQPVSTVLATTIATRAHSSMHTGVLLHQPVATQSAGQQLAGQQHHGNQQRAVQRQTIKQIGSQHESAVRIRARLLMLHQLAWPLARLAILLLMLSDCQARCSTRVALAFHVAAAAAVCGLHAVGVCVLHGQAC